MIEVYTLVDITSTGIHRNYPPHGAKIAPAQWDFQRNQQRNWETVIQLLGLRFQPMDISAPKILSKEQTPIELFELEYKNSWYFTCNYDRPININDFISDFHNIPIITGLAETAKFSHPCFISTRHLRNITIISKI